MRACAITLLSSSESRFEKYARTEMTVLEEQWLMQSKMVAASCGESNFRRKLLFLITHFTPVTPFYPSLPYSRPPLALMQLIGERTRQKTKTIYTVKRIKKYCLSQSISYGLSQALTLNL